MTFDEAMALVRAGGRARRAGWARADSLNFNHLVGRDRVAERRRTEAVIYLVEVYPGLDTPGSGIVGVVPYSATVADQAADDWKPFELPEEWCDLESDIDHP